MATETERKFLLKNDDWRKDAGPGIKITQAYLSTDPARTVRIRQMGGEAFLTVKGKPSDSAPLDVPEFEYAIPFEDAQDMLALCLPGRIIKTRYPVIHGNHTFVVDVFDGAHAGLVLAEIELASAAEKFSRPDWLGDEVTDDPQYKNAALSQKS